MLSDDVPPGLPRRMSRYIVFHGIEFIYQHIQHSFVLVLVYDTHRVAFLAVVELHAHVIEISWFSKELGL